MIVVPLVQLIFFCVTNKQELLIKLPIYATVKQKWDLKSA